MKELRCPICNKKLGEELEGEITLKCPRCKNTTKFDSKKQTKILCAIMKLSDVSNYDVSGITK